MWACHAHGTVYLPDYWARYPKLTLTSKTSFFHLDFCWLFKRDTKKWLMFKPCHAISTSSSYVCHVLRYFVRVLCITRIRKFHCHAAFALPTIVLPLTVLFWYSQPPCETVIIKLTNAPNGERASLRIPTLQERR